MSDLEYTIEDAAKRLFLTKNRIAQLCRQRKIPGAHKILNGRKWLIPVETINEMTSSHSKRINPTKQEMPTPVIPSQQPIPRSLHKQKIIDAASSLDSEIRLPELSDSFFYSSTDRQTTIRSIPLITVNEDGEISVHVIVDTEAEMDIVHAGLRSHLETGGFLNLLNDIHNWKVGLELYLKRCRDILEKITPKEQNTVNFSDDVERNESVGYKREFFLSACADAITRQLQTKNHNPTPIDEMEIASRNYFPQKMTNGLWLLTRYGFGGIYVARSERQAKIYIHKHRALIMQIVDYEETKEVVKIRLGLQRLIKDIKKQLEIFREIEQVPGYCELCVPK